LGRSRVRVAPPGPSEGLSKLYSPRLDGPDRWGSWYRLRGRAAPPVDPMNLLGTMPAEGRRRRRRYQLRPHESGARWERTNHHGDHVADGRRVNWVAAWPLSALPWSLP
jgi:hypothetical protein